MTTLNLRIKGLLQSEKRGAVLSASLRDALGDDCRLLSDATVTGVELQGRWYISVSVSTKHEKLGLVHVGPVPLVSVPKTSLSPFVGDSLKTAQLLMVPTWDFVKAMPVHQTVARQETKDVKTLARHQPQSVNRLDRLGRSPLWWAAAEAKAGIIETLLACGALVSLSDDMGLTSLHISCRFDNLFTGC